ncbi:MAG: Homoserine dehydrogenase [Alphaproteobacteria bacterium MarineAlpha5_Bin8]|nr:MAG: Homoserine dehydrogenase [Alphaproteobacteria bacterium MarineAlpha5_Bin8]PPR45899.1 MAG: Homoserine dehydrogenase [Alphaproteobacteria bacterium MarineAlpha5_Bin7]PPR53163.1 MAG: Homoserine dehydrogenase [Alphaproteobacteria bacterium MarineAlpha5_Bin6]|tara:strand:- start:99 stop:1403 length:1305 start_codon:yes stop_codon:yes gene_type:complete
MIEKKTLNICIAGLGTVGSSVIQTIMNNQGVINKKSDIYFNILGISANNKNKKRSFNTDSFTWYENPLDLAELKDCNVIVELIGEEKGISFELVKKALENKINVVTANKALLSRHGNELFEIAEKNSVLLLFEAAVAGGIPIIKILKESVYLHNIIKISGILNGTTNFILTEMENKNASFDQILKEAQKNGYAEANPTNDIEGIDAAHKLSLISSLSFGSTIDFESINYLGISNIHIDDIKNADKLGYKIKLISETEVINNKLKSVVEPKLIKKKSYLANINGVLNAIKIKTDQLNPLILVGEGAGGKATASSIISDLYDIIKNTNHKSLGFTVKKLQKFDNFDIQNNISSYYLRIMVKDIPGVLAEITSNLNKQGISVETIFQIPENNIDSIPIIIVTHEISKNFLLNAVSKIEELDFVSEKIAIITIDKSLE